MKRILLVDNYDSFTYNLAQAFGELGARMEVHRNDAVTVRRAERLRPTHVVISPGPKTPREAGVSNAIIRRFAGRVPVLGVCLGHQCIGHVYGGTVALAPRQMHGKTSPIYHDARGIFRGLPNPFEATRYHSLVVLEKGLPKALAVSAHTAEGEVMGLRHQSLAVEGVQFHPESIMTPHGIEILRNFLAMA